MEVSKKSAIKLCSAIWFFVGLMLLWKGLYILAENVKHASPDALPLVSFAAKYARDLEQAIMLLIAAGLLVGFVKGRIALRGSVNRIIKRFGEKVSLLRLYSKVDLAVLGSMVLLGALMRFLPVPMDVRGFVDVAIGSGLINGAMLFIRKLIYDRVSSR